MQPSSDALWKKLNEVTDKLQRVSEQLIESNAINKGYHQALEQQKIKIETLEESNHQARGAISALKWVMGIALSLTIPIGSWIVNSIHELKQDVAVIQKHNEVDNER